MRSTLSADQRFWPKVDKNGPVSAHRPDLGPCWLWTRSKLPHGYGAFGDENQRTVRAHRWAYEHVFGAVPEGLELDHLCRVPACVNPAHLEPVTHAENVRRGARANKTHCANGHELSGANLLVNRRKGWRSCRTCAYASTAAYLRRKAAAA